LGDTVRLLLDVDASGDANTRNQHDTILLPANDTRPANRTDVSPIGIGPDGQIDRADSVLTYTICFQNTDSLPVGTVVVADTLDPALDPATVLPGAASSLAQLEQHGNGVLVWRLRNGLTTIAAHRSASYGYVRFTVRLRRGLPLGTVIRNRADVYFDNQPPIVTTTAVNTLAKLLAAPRIDETSGVLTVWPNPANTRATVSVPAANAVVEVRNMLGALVASVIAVDRSAALDVGVLPPGLYIVRSQGPGGVLHSAPLVVAR
jgi:uncharacterized repeat protein (TIGR01451 family)